MLVSFSEYDYIVFTDVSLSTSIPAHMNDVGFPPHLNGIPVAFVTEAYELDYLPCHFGNPDLFKRA